MTTATFRTDDGLTIGYERWGSLFATRPPVFLHHGFAVDTQLNWVLPGVVKALTESGHTVVAIDARGHGRSDKPHDSAAYGEPRMARDLRALWDHLGVTRVDLVGYSMGSVVALLAAVADTRVERLVVGGVGAGIVELGGLDTRAVPNLAIAQALLADDPRAAGHPGAVLFRELVDAVGADREALAAHAKVVHQSPIALDQIRARTLVIAGRDDLLAVRPQRLADAIPGATLVLVPGDHMTAVAQPEFAGAIRAFLAEPRA